jgi:hypothetical protein
MSLISIDKYLKYKKTAFKYGIAFNDWRAKHNKIFDFSTLDYIIYCYIQK